MGRVRVCGCPVCQDTAIRATAVRGPCPRAVCPPQPQHVLAGHFRTVVFSCYDTSTLVWVGISEVPWKLGFKIPWCSGDLERRRERTGQRRSERRTDHRDRHAQQLKVYRAEVRGWGGRTRGEPRGKPRVLGWR